MFQRLLTWWRWFKGGAALPSFDWLGRTRTLAQAGQWQEAVMTCRYWTKEQPRNHLAWQHLGVALTNWGVTRETGQALLEAMAKEGFTTRLPYWTDRLDLAADTDPLLEAMFALRQALQLKSDDAASWYALGEVYHYFSDQAGVRAIAAILERYDSHQAAQLLRLLDQDKRSED